MQARAKKGKGDRFPEGFGTDAMAEKLIKQSRQRIKRSRMLLRAVEKVMKKVKRKRSR